MLKQDTLEQLVQRELSKNCYAPCSVLSLDVEMPWTQRRTIALARSLEKLGHVKGAKEIKMYVGDHFTFSAVLLPLIVYGENAQTGRPGFGSNDTRFSSTLVLGPWGRGQPPPRAIFASICAHCLEHRGRTIFGGHGPSGPEQHSFKI